MESRPLKPSHIAKPPLFEAIVIAGFTFPALDCARIRHSRHRHDRFTIDTPLNKPFIAGPLPTPIEQHVEAIAAGVSEIARRADDGSLTVGELIALLGQHSHTMVILVFSVLNMIPGPPGYGGTVAMAIMAVTVAMLLGRPLRVGGWVGQRRIPARLVGRMIDRLAFLARLLAHFSRPRLQALTGERAKAATGVFIMVVSAPMVLPIPLINAVPNVGIAVICLSRINRDGLGILIGIFISLLGLAIAAGAVWGVVSLAQIVLAG